MIIFPNCKINLGLQVLNKRTDGYHDIETIFYPLPLNDILEVIHSNNEKQGVNFSTSGLAIKDEGASNICINAYLLLQKDFSQIPPVDLHLHKTIPVGAGLGGGSADGAFTLMLLNNKFNLGLTTEQLLAYALQLGSDCPFFILNRPCHATGRGEVLEPVDINLESYRFAVIYPGIHINTGWAFSQLKNSGTKQPLKEIIKLAPEQWKDNLQNDFEAAVFPQYPELKEIKEQLYQSGAVYASMSGSGSTIFGLFKDMPALPTFPEHYFVKFI